MSRAEDIHALAERYAHGEVSAEDYFAACDRWAHEMVEAELADMARARRKVRRP